MSEYLSTMARRGLDGGTGRKLTNATIILAGISSLIASLLSLVSIWYQTKNYRKPLLQRYVIRILLMVPIYSLSSWLSIISLQAAMFVEPIRDIYEAFTIYTFFQLLINFIGGERALIIMMHGREPVNHLWPMNYCLSKIDISDPHTFLAIKRGILQYAWLKPILGFASVIMKATGTYKEGYLGLNSGYLWSGIAYNLSVTISLYSLGLFWVCMSNDLKPFRPVPKFLCVKLIIFASYWQGFFLSILVWLGAIPDNVDGYTSDNLASAIQDALICVEMPIFAITHWYAFSWHDYADITISAARMRMKYALRDALGVRDLIEDTKETFSGNKYEYRLFDSGDNTLAHESSSSRVAKMMEGMRYERGGKGKYWIPKPGEVNVRTPLISNERFPSLSRKISPSPSLSADFYSSVCGNNIDEEPISDHEEEDLYKRARNLEHGDWNYPVITVHEACARGRHEPVSSLLHETLDNQLREPLSRKKKVNNSTLKDHNEPVRVKPKKKESCGKDIQTHISNSSSPNIDKSQLVDLIIEDTEAEHMERYRAKKEGSASWNKIESKRFVRTYGHHIGEEMRVGPEPFQETVSMNLKHAISDETIDDEINGGERGLGSSEGSRQWRELDSPPFELKPKYGLEDEAFENVWGRGELSHPPRENP